MAIGLGIGATTAIFSILDSVVLRPLPYVEPQNLVMIWETNHAESLEREPLSPVNFMDYRAIPSIEDAAAWWNPTVNLVDPKGDPVRVNTIEASSNFFALMGVAPLIGPGFPNSDPLHGSEREVVISYRLWSNRFGSDPEIVGKDIQLNGRLFTILGVMPRGFHFPGDTDAWQRLRWDLSQHSRGAHFMEAVARLRNGMSLAQAQGELNSLTQRLGQEYEGTNGGWGAEVFNLHDEVVGFFKPALYTLLGAVGLLLLIACINVANLLLARTTARAQETAVRSALGASRIRLIRQFLTESLLLAALGSGFGLLLAYGGLKILVRATPVDIPRLEGVTMDVQVLGLAVLLILVTTIMFGLAPAIVLAATGAQKTLQESGRSIGSAAVGQRARQLFVVAEIGLSVMLLVGAGLLIRSVSRLLDEDPGFNPAPVLTAELELSGSDYSDWEHVGIFYSRLLKGLRDRPELTAAGASNFLPLAAGWRIEFLIEGEPPVRAGDEPTAQHHSVDEGYFNTLGIPLLQGRNFDERDSPERPGVVIVNEAFARRYWPNESPLGRRIISFASRIGPLGRRLIQQREHEIVGVVGNIRNTSLRRPAEPAIYHTQRQFPFLNMHIVVRGSGGLSQLASIMREEVARLDPKLPLSDIRTMERVVQASVEQPRFLMYLMSSFAILALLLAAIGIYGLLSYAVNLSRRDLSVRMAFGAQPGDLVWQVVRRGLLLAVLGAGLGILAAILGSRLMAALLYGTSPTDSLTLIGVSAVVMAIALLASFIPARRAALLDPVAGLRAE
jgi:putative ABC transport system permease protein